MFRPTRMGVRMWRAYGPWATSLRGMLWLIARLNRASPIAETIAGLDPKPVSDETVPQVVFSFPEAASVGLALDDAKSCETIINPQETAYPMLSNSRMLMSGEGGSMTIVSGAMAGAPDVPLVLGVHIVSRSPAI